MNEEMMMEPKRQRSLSEACDELERELNVRRRCMPRWVREGRVSQTDATDRVERLATALQVLRGIEQAPAQAVSQ